MENTALKNGLAETLDALEYIDEYGDTELSAEFIAELNRGLEQMERGEGISAEELKEKYSKKYGIKF